jgi:GTP-binding protein
MVIRSAIFVKSSSTSKGLPALMYPEYAFIGRSNVGKSSLINMLTGKKKLAKTSNTPGKTRLINHFLINDAWYLVDLPGTGYAKVSQKERMLWEKLTYTYLEKRKSLLHTFMLVDSRLKPQAIDLELINRLGEKQIPFSLVFTKTDKLTKNELHNSIQDYSRTLLTYWEELPQFFITSAETKKGKTDILNCIGGLNSIFRPELLTE